MGAKKTLPQTLKGFRDFLPEAARKRQWLKDKLTAIFEFWGYEPLETPTLESLELFKGQIGEEEKLFFNFKDAGGRSVALRYDQTVPACRVIAQYLNNPITLPFKRYQIQPAFRAEKPQKGRYREFLQADADIFGVSSPLADAEAIALSLDIYKQLGFTNAKVLINDRQLLKDLPYKAIVAIDKLKKIGEEGVIATMVNQGIDKSSAEEYLNVVKNLKPNDAINLILNYLKAQGFDANWYAFDPTIARSFSYSSGPIWEVVVEGFTAGSVLGGERFDNLINQISGLDIPATGFAVGFDRTLEAAEQFGLVPAEISNKRLLVTLFNPESVTLAVKTAQALRKAGISTEVYPDESAKLEKQLKYADQKKIGYVLMAGPEEVAKDMVTLKDMKAKSQETLTLDAVIKKLK